MTALAKRLALAVLRDAYVERERVAMIAFRERSAELLFAPTDQVERVHDALDSLPFGGTTPLPDALVLARRVLADDANRNPNRDAKMILVSDGRANVGSHAGFEKTLAEVEASAEALRAMQDVPVLFLDTTEPGKKNLEARRLAAALGARRLPLSALTQSGRDPGAALRRTLNPTPDLRNHP